MSLWEIIVKLANLDPLIENTNQAIAAMHEAFDIHKKARHTLNNKTMASDHQARKLEREAKATVRKFNDD